MAKYKQLREMVRSKAQVTLSRFLALVALSSLLTSCTHAIGIEISMRAGKPVFGFHDCGRLWKSQVKAEEVEVYEVGEGGRMTLVCSAKLTGDSEWTYGHMAQHCPPLEADKIYEVAADKPGSMGIRRFRLSSAGALQPLMPAC